ncbi:MAG: hypothetical protein N2505_06355, partial [Endomicrobia bacterium]|nr:hypothetical protein [Endomicrobiia bacterium]
MSDNTFNKGNLIPIKKLVFDIKKGSILRTYYISYSKYKKIIERIKSEKNKVRLNTSNNDLLNYYKKFSNRFFLVNSIKTYFSEDYSKLLSQQQINNIKQILPDSVNNDLFNFISKSINTEDKKVLSKNNVLNKMSSNIVSYIITSDSYYLDGNQKLIKDKLAMNVINNSSSKLDCDKVLEDLSDIVEINIKSVKTNNTGRSGRKINTFNNFSINQNLFDTLMIGYDYLLEGKYTSNSENETNIVNVFETKIKLKPLNNKVEVENKEDARLINNVINRNFCFYGIYYGRILNYLNPHETKLKEIFKFLIGNTVDVYDKMLISNIPFNINILLKFRDKLPVIIDNMFFFLDSNLNSINNNILLKEDNQYRYSVYLYSTLFNNLNTIYKIDKNYFYNILSFVKDNIFITGSKKDLIYFVYNLFERNIRKNDIKEYIYSSLYNSYLSD